MNDFITLQMLGTFSGITVAVTMLTQVIKNFVAVDPKWIALFLSFLLTLGIQVLPNALSATSIVIAFCNWLLVTGTSIGLFEGVVKPIVSSTQKQ